MNPDRYRQAGELFDAALALEPRARAAFLARSCGADSALRAEVESLLDAHQQTGSFIDEPPAAVAAEVMAKRDARARAGQQVGRYRIVRLLGKGGMGEVHLAEDTLLDRRVALKILPAESTNDDTRVRRFIQEAKSASALNHPNIISVYEIGQDAGVHFMATELVEGATLRETLRKGPFSISEVVDIAIQTATALAAAHAAGVVHRDIKPENIMRRPDGLVKVLDFGIAKLITGRTTQGRPATGRTQGLTGPGVILGTLPYISPERVRMLPADARSDIFSLGIVLHEMIAGRPPFEGETLNDVIEAVLVADPEPLAELRPETPIELQRIAGKALRKNPAERYQSCDELLIDLRKLQQRLDSRAKAITRSLRQTLVIQLPRGGSILPASAKETAGPNLWLIYVLAALLGVLAGGTVWWWIGRGR